MDTSYLAQQVTSIIGQLHTIFDEIGIPHHDRDSRESELFSSLSEALHNHLRQVSTEKNELIDEGQRIITTIRQMEASLEDPKPQSRNPPRDEDDDLQVTYPLLECLEALREKQRTVSRLHEERYEQVKKLVQALQSYSAHLEPSFVQIKLPPVAPNTKVAPTFDLSPSYITKVDTEFTRVYDEYMKRVALVQELAGDIVNLWAELGIPQAQTDAAVVKHGRDSPEQLGLHQSDIDRLQAKRDSLRQEKTGREKKLQRLKSEVEALWVRLCIEEKDRKAFTNANRGCGLRAINDFEAELSRLNELKRQNLHLFVEDARNKLNALWDELYISEEEAVEFTPMFCDVYSDALLAAHEQEIARLETLRDQRAPTLSLIAKHRSIIKDKEDLAASSQDASRLLAKGAKGEKRDPTRLLREEKMRKRITRELPKVEQELIKVLGAWEEEYGRPFLVFGERYLDDIEAMNLVAAPPRSKTPNNFAASTMSRQAAPPPRPATAAAHRKDREPATTLRSKPAAAPSQNSTLNRPTQAQTLSSSRAPASGKSPSRIPARVPLSSRADGGNSPERRPQRAANPAFDGKTTIRGGHMAPPPKMRDLHPVAQPSNTPVPQTLPISADLLRSGSVVRQIAPEDPYSDPRAIMNRQNPAQPTNGHREMPPPPRPAYRGPADSYYAPSETASSVSRQISGSSNSTAPSSVANSGSENWETYGSDDEDEAYAAAQAHRPGTKRAYPDGSAYVDGRFEGYPSATIRGGAGAIYGGHMQGGSIKKLRPNGGAVQSVIIDEHGHERIVSNSEAGWTDEELCETY